MESELDNLLYTLPSAETCRNITEQAEKFWSSESNFSPTIKDVRRILKQYILEGCKKGKSFIDLKIAVKFSKEIVETLKTNGFTVVRTMKDTINDMEAYMYVISWYSEDDVNIPEQCPENPVAEQTTTSQVE